MLWTEMEAHQYIISVQNISAWLTQLHSLE